MEKSFLTMNFTITVGFLVLISCARAFNPFNDATEVDYMSSAYAVRSLAGIEQKLLPDLIAYKDLLETRLEGLHKYIDEITTEMQLSKSSFHKIRNISIFDTESFAIEGSAHIHKSMHVIKRFTNVLPRLQRSVEDNGAEKLFQNSIQKWKKLLPFPTGKDAVQSLLSIIRLKQTYNISGLELMNGNLHGLRTYSGLTADDITQLGVVAYRTRVFPTCFELLETSLKFEKEANEVDHSKVVKLENLINQAIRRHDADLADGTFDSEKNPYHYLSPLVSIKSDSFQFKVPKQLVYDIADLNNFMGVQVAFGKLCSGEQLREPSVSKNYNCELLGGVNTKGRVPHYFILRPLKLEHLNKDPPIVLVHDVLTDNEIDKIQNMSQPKLQRSKVTAKTESAQINFGRTSTNTWFPDYNPESPFHFIAKRVQMITGLFTTYEAATEDLQVANYGPGGLYAPHYDTARTLEEFGEGSLGLYHERGDRIATFMFYLNEIERGGGTAFPGVGIAVQPIKGSAVFWYNLQNNGSTHLKTMHGGCPVLCGSKWIANKWIRSNEQMFIRKCKAESPGK